MNKMLFVDNISLGFADSGLYRSEIYRDYMSLHRRFPIPPGIEFFMPRNRIFTVNNPWGLTESSFKIPEARSITFTDAVDSFGQSIANEMDNGKQVYIFWSGGIDSTCVAVSVLKFAKQHHKEQITIVTSDSSINENPYFYENHLKELKREDFSSFGFGNVDVKNAIVLDGEGGDQIFGSSLANKVLTLHPDKMNLPWETQIDFITKQLRKPWDNSHTWELFFNLVTGTIDNNVPVETVQDFFWWLNFNFKFDAVMQRTLLYYGNSIPDSEFQYFAQHSSRRLFAHKEVQQWSMTRDASGKSQGGKKIKLPAKQYIYEFDKNEYYYREKRKLLSTPMFNRKYFALGSDYKRYSFEDREVRQKVRKLFYPNAVGQIDFVLDIGGPKFEDMKIWKANPKNS